MTIEEIRAAKAVAESRIHNILVELRGKTGTCPLDVHVTTVGYATMASKGPSRMLGSVTIEMEPI